jgi:hypothetical protein
VKLPFRPPRARSTLFVLDVLPGHCALEAQTMGESIRFRAVDDGSVASEWSGWFPLRDCPIRLAWRSFWPDP